MKNPELSRPAESSHKQRIARLAALGIVANGAMHEITNPLNAIIMNAELALTYLEQGVNGDELKNILTTIVGESKRAGSLAQSVTEFARTTDFAPSHSVNLNDVMSKARSLLGSRLRQSNIELLINTKAPLPTISAKPLALALAIASLVDLAIENGSRRVQISLMQSEAELLLKIHAMQDNDKVNDLLSSSQSGYGQLMMDLTGQIIADHQATLSIEDKVYFTIRFPNPPN